MGEARVTEHDRHNRVLAGTDPESGLRHRLPKPASAGGEAVTALGGAGQEVQAGKRGAHDGRRERVGEQVGARPLPEERR